MEKHEPKLIPKAKSHAFGKDVYLLGRGDDGGRLWLEAPKWDCEWYWGFGYVETYGRRSNDVDPAHAGDINSHTHVNSLIFLKCEIYDFEKKCFRLSSDYLHHWNDQPDLKESTLTDSESWQFSDLMKSFYTFRETAAIYYQGNSHLASTGEFSLKNRRAWRRINTKEIPRITAAALNLLTPAGAE